MHAYDDIRYSYSLPILFVTVLETFCVLSQDIINDDEFNLDWFFKMSLIHDIVHVSPLLLVMFLLFIGVAQFTRSVSLVVSY